MINPRAVHCTNYVNKRIYTAIPKAVKIKYAALHEMAVQAFRGKVVRSGAF